MTEFKWTPEAIRSLAWELAVEDDRHHLARNSQLVLDGYERQARRYLNIAAAHMQPVVALPPCQTCGGGKGTVPESCDVDVGKTTCPACNGSGVERMIPESEIRAWIRSFWSNHNRPPKHTDILRWLDERRSV